VFQCTYPLVIHACGVPEQKSQILGRNRGLLEDMVLAEEELYMEMKLAVGSVP
jgi:hypothetical protein